MKFEDYNFRVHSNGNIAQASDNIEKVKKALNDKSPSLCLAKFTQVTMHLESGTVHSCHHPAPHKIPLAELEENPAALFNTSVLKVARKEMLNGKRPPECGYCWRAEDNGNTSDRIYKSNETWALPYYNKIVESTGDEMFIPTSLEVSFGNTCNLKCAYCGPEYSSKWVEELKTQGPLKVTAGLGKEQWIQGWQNLDEIAILNRDHNPYVEAFWKWFPEIYPKLKQYRITGGEPLLNKNTMRSLDYILENPRKDLELGINTNLSVPDKLWDQFVDKLIELEKSAKFKKITIFYSFESWDKRAAYSRTGIEFEKVTARVKELLEKTSVRCTLMATYNILAITSFKEVLEWILSLKKQYNVATGSSTTFNYRVGLDTPYLRHPEMLDAMYCDEDLFLKYMKPCLEFMKENESNIHQPIGRHDGFEAHEISRFDRNISNRMQFQEEDNSDAILKNRAKFYDFVNQLDKRRGTNFLETFPEMTDFYNKAMQCKKEFK
jgi:organic radical activating enzyme